MHSSDFSRFGFTYGRIASISPRPPSSARILRPAFRLSRSIYTKIRIAARNRGRGNRVSCASRRYLDIYTIEKTFLSR